MDLMPFFLGFSVYFISTFLRGIQHKNVIHHKVIGAAVFSAAICFFDNMAIILVATNSNYWFIPANMFGAAMGMLTSIVLYEYIRRRNQGVE